MNVYIVLIILSVILTVLGGYSDMTNKSVNLFGINVSKQHLWNDASYILLLAIALKHIVG